MEYVEGQSLASFLKEKVLSLKGKLTLFKAIALAVQHAHSQQVIHGDIKPDNIIISRLGEVKLIDFGVSREVDCVTYTGADVDRKQGNILDYLSAYSEGYTSPEQLAGESPSTFSDIYSLGALLSFILSEGTSYAIEQQDKENKYAIELVNIIAMAKSTSSVMRFTTVDEMKRELERFQENLPITSMTYSLSNLAVLFYRRNRLSSIFSATFLLALTMGFTGFAYQNVQLRQEKKVNNQVFRSISTLLNQIDPTRKNITQNERINTIILLEKRIDWSKLTGVSAVRYATYLANAYTSVGEINKAISLLESLEKTLPVDVISSPDSTYLINIKLADLYFLIGKNIAAKESVSIALAQYPMLSLDVEEVLSQLNTRAEFLEFATEENTLINFIDWIENQNNLNLLSLEAKFAFNNIKIAYHVKRSEGEEILTITTSNLKLIRENKSRVPAYYYVSALSGHYATVENLYGSDHVSLKGIPGELNGLLEKVVKEGHPQFNKILSLLLQIYLKSDFAKASDLYLKYELQLLKSAKRDRRLSGYLSKFLQITGRYAEALSLNFRGVEIAIEKFGYNENSQFAIANPKYTLANTVAEVMGLKNADKYYQELQHIVTEKQLIPYIAIQSAYCKSLINYHDIRASKVCGNIAEVVNEKLSDGNSFILDSNSMLLSIVSYINSLSSDRLEHLIKLIEEQVGLSQNIQSTKKAYERLFIYYLERKEVEKAFSYLVLLEQLRKNSNYTIKSADMDLLYARYYQVIKNLSVGQLNFDRASEYLCRFMPSSSFRYRRLEVLSKVYGNLPESCQNAALRDSQLKNLQSKFENQLHKTQLLFQVH